MRASRGIGSRILQGGRVRYPCPAQSLAHAIALGIYGENRARDRISLLADVSTSERAPKDGILGWFVVPVREIAKCPRPGCFRVLLYVRGYVERVAFPGVLRTVRSASRTHWSLATVYRYIGVAPGVIQWWARGTSATLASRASAEWRAAAAPLLVARLMSSHPLLSRHSTASIITSPPHFCPASNARPFV